VGRVARLVLVAFCTWALPAGAVRVDGVYAETVPVAGNSPEATEAAFREALRGVLVKATGRAEAGRDPALLGRFGDTRALVQQYRRDAGGALWVQFDPAAVRRGLAAGGYPAWGDDRPLSVVWLAYDAGEGERDILGSSAVEGAAGGLRRELLAAASARAVPVVLPLRDSQELAAVSFGDVWGGFPEPVMRASGRYQADAILIGRARLVPAGMTDVRWTLLTGEERTEWRGSVADGPAGLAERLGQRLAAAGGPGGGVVRLAVAGVTTFGQYGALLAYLQGLDVIERVTVAGAAAQALQFDLVLRGDPDRLEKAFAVRRVLEPDTGAATPPPGAGGTPGELRYRLGAAP
jgi:hypothetical protein